MEGLVALVCDKYDGSLKAEHGTGVNMAPYVAREWGEQATELMWRVKRLADPDGVLGPGRRHERRPGRPPPEPEDDARGRGGREHLRRVRLLRARLPEPGPDDDAAPAHRAAARDGAPARGLAGGEGACGGVRVRRSRDLRRRRLVRARLPALDRHGQAGEGAAGEGALARAKRRWRFAPRRAGARSSAHRARAFAPGRSPSGSAAATCRSPRSRCPRSTTREGAAAVYFPSCTNRIMGASKKAAPGPEPGRRHGRRLRARRACRSGSRPTSAEAAAACRGRPRATARAMRGWRARRSRSCGRWSDEGALPIVSDASSCTLGLTTETLAALPEDVQERHAKLEILDSVEWVERLLPNLEHRAKARPRRDPPDLRDPPPRPGRAPLGRRGRDGRRGRRARRRPLLRLRGRPRDAPPRADRLGDRAAGRRAARARPVRRLPLDEPDVRDRHGARDGRALRLDRARRSKS